jgi:hypothetical protein
MPRLIDLTGKRFGMLEALRPGGPRVLPSGYARLFWWVRCDCGTVKEVAGSNLRVGYTRSCGCNSNLARSVKLRSEAKANYPREYYIWESMKARCKNPNRACYKNYGGRGIVVCPRWDQSFEGFLADMGPCPDGYTIERIDNNRGYEPGNCRWASYKEQGRNQRSNHLLTFRGETRTIAEWTEILGFKRATIGCRINKHGWSVERALTTPARRWGR